MKHLLYFLICFSIIGTVHAQEISFTSDTLRKFNDPGAVVPFHCQLENLWTQSNQVALRMEPHLPNGWNVHICNKMGCAPVGVLYVVYTLEPLEVDTLVSVSIHSAPDPDSGWVVTYAFSLEDSNAYRDTLTHTLITYPQGVVVTTQPGIPQQFRLAQNYPNPFNPSTTITISIPDFLNGQEAKLQVFNILGQEIRRLFQGPVASGTLVIHWDGTDNGNLNAPSGTYFYRFSAGQVETVRTMQLMR
jgi:hypothetical protein